jgi:hypothetical protein
MNDKLLFGADPEIFSVYSSDKAYDEFLAHKEFTYPPAALENVGWLTAIGGDDKHPIYLDKDNFRVIGDGAAFELNFKRPFENPKHLFEETKNALVELNYLVRAISEDTLSLSQHPVVNFDYREFWTDEIKEGNRLWWGFIFGCDKDMDAFNVDWLCEILNERTHPYRYGGGHLHVSGSDKITESPLVYTQLMALHVGNYCIANSPYPELEKIRAKYYGKPGKHRIQNYPDGMSGVEYRTPSNSWLSYTNDLWDGMIDQVYRVLKIMDNLAQAYNDITKFSEQTIKAITTADQDLSKQLLKEMEAN